MAMFCPHCGAPTDEADMFCVICGELVQATAVCGVCGESIPISAAFCPECGANFLEHPELSIQGPQKIHAPGKGVKPARGPVEDGGGEEGAELPPLVELDGDGGDEPTSQPRRSRPRLPRALQKALGMQEEAEDEEPAPEDPLPEEAEEETQQWPEELEGEDDGVDTEDDLQVPSTKKQKGKSRWRRKKDAVKCQTEEPDDETDPEDEADGSKKEKKKLFAVLLQKFKRKHDDGDEERVGFFARLKARFRKDDDANEVESEEGEPDLDDDADDIQEEPKKKVPGLIGRRKKVKKADLDDEQAKREFSEKANYDGYYDDVRPVDYGETDEERGQLDIKAVLLLIVGLIIFCVVAIKLQALL